MKLQYRIRVVCENDHVNYVPINGGEEYAEKIAAALDGRAKLCVRSAGICQHCRAPFQARVEEIVTHAAD